MAKLLIVDDSNLMVSVIRNFASKSGKELEILEAHTGEDAIATFERERPDLVFLDIKMPGMDGLTALERIRALDATAKVVICSSLMEEEHKARAKAAGAVGYIMKPFRSDDIIEAVNRNVL